MGDEQRHIRLILCEILYEVGVRIQAAAPINLAQPIIATDADIDGWVTAQTSRFDEIGATESPSGTYVNDGEPLGNLADFLIADERGLIRELTATAAWWAATEAVERGPRGRREVVAPGGAMWQLKRAKATAIAERSVELEGAAPPLVEVGKDLVAELGDAARRFG